jgi:hypothetical protein
MRNDCPCGQPVGTTAYLCTRCRRTLVIALIHVSAGYQDLDTVRARQTRYSTGGRSNEDPPGMDMRFGKDGAGTRLIHDARNTAVTWVRYIAEYVSEVEGPVCRPGCGHGSCKAVVKTRMPADTVPAMCAYLIRWSDWLRVSPGGPDALTDFTNLEKRLGWIVGRPADQWYAGPCDATIRPPIHDGMTCACSCHRSAYTMCDVAGGCGLNFTTGATKCTEELYAKTDAGKITCRACRTVHDIAERRVWLLAMAENREETESTIARAIAHIEYKDGSERMQRTLDQRIRKWASRNQITPLRHEKVNGRLRPLYRVGEVLDRLAEDAREEQAKKVRLEEKRKNRASRRAS